MTKKKAVQAKETSKKKEKNEIIFKIGRRKVAVAKVTARPGTGKILVNGEPLRNNKNAVLRLRMEEPFILTEKEEWKTYDFTATAKGGGSTGQADAIRQAFSRALVEIFGQELKQKYMAYDRNLLVYDPRRTETHKPPRSSQGPRRYKQRSKR